MLEVNPDTGLIEQKKAEPPPSQQISSEEDGKLTFLEWADQMKQEEKDREAGAAGVSVFVPAPLDLAQSLLTRPPSTAETGCRNVIERPNLWTQRAGLDVQHAYNPWWPLLNHLVSVCKAAKIYECDNPECTENASRINYILPSCEWQAFRDWVVQVVSCQMTTPESERTTGKFLHLSAAVVCINYLLEGIKLQKFTSSIDGKYIDLTEKKRTIDLFPICEIIYWSVNLQEIIGISPFLMMLWGNTMIPHGVVAPALAKVTQLARERGICLSRLWSLSLISDRGEHDLPAIMHLAQKYPELSHKSHGSCTASCCGATTMDATRLKQLHKCEHDTEAAFDIVDCKAKKLFFDPELLRVSIEGGGGTTWCVDEPFEVQNLNVPYVTISHVWSDGTGVGIEAPGYVNRCLFDYFAGFVKQLGYSALWWDSISIPMDPTLRGKAINDMHSNYSRSKITLVHDTYLSSFEWRDDGSPALALILSPWFSRGWTAVECNMARKIKVVFKAPGKNEPIIKDLDDDILAKDFGLCSRAHWIASYMIKRLRQPITNVSDLLAILKPRSTSWARDRMIIAGLLARVEVDYKMTPETITKAIITKIGAIDHSSLLHVETAMTESGGWSWCPNFIYDLPAIPPGEFKTSMIGGASCLVDRYGTITGEFPCRRATRDDFFKRRVIPLSSHPFIVSRIKAALENWQNCLIVGDYPGPYVLVETELENDDYYPAINYTPEHEFLMCKYLGTVQTAGDDEMYTPENFDSLVKTRIMIGREGNNYLDAPHYRKFVTQEQLSTKFSPFTSFQRIRWEFSTEHIYIGDNPITGDLLLLRKRTVPHPTFGAEVMIPVWAAHNLEVKGIGSGKVEIDVKPEPCFSLSPARVIESFSEDWSSEKPNFSYVDVAKYWPTLRLASNERTTSLTHLRDHQRGDSSIVPSNRLFRLDFLSRTVTYAAIDFEILEISEERPWAGIWACIFPSGKYEFHLFIQKGEEDINVIKLTSNSTEAPRGAEVLRIYSKLEPKYEDARGQLASIYLKDKSTSGVSDTKYDDEWGYIGLMIMDEDTIDVRPYPPGIFRVTPGEEFKREYRRVPQAVLMANRPKKWTDIEAEDTANDVAPTSEPEAKNLNSHCVIK
ncbi:hypothetical protein H072_11608 [Dactylellina haptotyla CBS 200.50]|uniref:Heterokaryon incompatibility domain-containing protein n=1 Tax=Dactylellina haptotyla (strain CBS 200.50) TaxID=1284197 RepID=S7ZWQ5_DACHA|nr:hypothetical protein H072_11608 [Dactylellina haptotyla CBS 200.50]